MYRWMQEDTDRYTGGYRQVQVDTGRHRKQAGTDSCMEVQTCTYRQTQEGGCRYGKLQTGADRNVNSKRCGTTANWYRWEQTDTGKYRQVQKSSDRYRKVQTGKVQTGT